jgi:hypothetical protein
MFAWISSEISQELMSFPMQLANQVGVGVGGFVVLPLCTFSHVQVMAAPFSKSTSTCCLR